MHKKQKMLKLKNRYQIISLYKVNGMQAIFRLCIAALTAAVLTLMYPVSATAEDTGAETVRVGYYENEVFQEGASEGAVKNGYAYEYYRKLSEYTGWKYEYVYGSFSDMYQMLLDGDIDLLAGLAFKEDSCWIRKMRSSSGKAL